MQVQNIQSNGFNFKSLYMPSQKQLLRYGKEFALNAEKQRAAVAKLPLFSGLFDVGQAGFYPPPAALAGFPPGSVPAAQGRLVPPALVAHSPFAAGSCVRFPPGELKTKTLSSGCYHC